MSPSTVQANLSDYTTFQLGGPCKGLIECQTPQECVDAVRFCADHNYPFIVIGGGSNLLVSDQGVDCFVICYKSVSPLFDIQATEVTVSGSTNLNDFTHVMAQVGLAGINYASGIPGTVGGAVVGNAGAFGKQIGDVLLKATLLSKSGQKRIVLQKAFEFTYRHSVLKETDDIVLDVTLQMTMAERDALLAERQDILRLRSEKHPDLSKEPCAGSFFRNIEPSSKADKRQAAGWFLEQAGVKSLKVGGAHIFSKHANIIIKGQNCTAEDVRALAEKMADRVKEKHNLDLIREVRFVGPFKNATPSHQTIMW